MITLASCKKEGYSLLSQAYADVPVTVSNRVAFYNGVPYVETSKSGTGAISIVLEIPAGSGRTIKEITRVGTSTGIPDYKVVHTSAGNYNTEPIRGSGTSVTFTTSLTEYTAKTGLAAPATAGTASSFLARYFYFMLTLDNGQQLIAVPVRVYVNA
ncbi:MAG TPA: hypothetical protein VEV15_11240 [Flavisolibacter sp.]|nr:hypothetical protein [Flavisolibacter sp.]